MIGGATTTFTAKVLFEAKQMSLTVGVEPNDAPVQPAPLLRETMANNSTFVGPDYTFIGYGRDDGVNDSDFGTRRRVSFRIKAVGPMSIDVDTTRIDIDATEFFYAVPRKNTCMGDSGGPAFIIRNRVERLAGVTSQGDPHCKIWGVQARTDIPQIHEFIQPKLDEIDVYPPEYRGGSWQVLEAG